MTNELQEELEGVVKHCMNGFSGQAGPSNNLSVSLLDQSVDEVF
jgi:hypothetical protein